MLPQQKAERKNIVIVGGGVIGCTTAYYLTRHPKYDPSLHIITLVEASAVASGASGKAGGLLGLWAYPSELVPLSYRLHSDLSAEHDGVNRWGYRRLKGCPKLEIQIREEDLPPECRPKQTKQTKLKKLAKGSSPGKAPKRKKRTVVPQPENVPPQVKSRRHSQQPTPLKKHEQAPVTVPVAVDMIPGRTTGSGTRWRSITQFSDGKFVYHDDSLPDYNHTKNMSLQEIKNHEVNGKTDAKTDGWSNGAMDRDINGDVNGKVNGAVNDKINDRVEDQVIVQVIDQTQGNVQSNSDASYNIPGPASTNGLADDAIGNLAGHHATNGQDENPDKMDIDVGPEDQGAWHKLPKQDAAATQLLTKASLPKDLDWVLGHLVSRHYQMGHSDVTTETAQVHPYQFTTAMATLAQERGVKVHLGARVTAIRSSAEGAGAGGVSSVEYLDRASNTTRTIHDVTDVLVAAGPWTPTLLPGLSIVPTRVHSVVWAADVSPYAVFTDIKLPPGYLPAHRAKKGLRRKHTGKVDPEVYARPFGEVYACGETDDMVPLPATADLVETDEGQCEDLVAYLGLISPVLAAAPIKARQACYIPRWGKEGVPLLGPTSTRGLWVASGHTCWGIQNAPATGRLMAEMMLDGVATSLAPEVMAQFDPRQDEVGDDSIVVR